MCLYCFRTMLRYACIKMTLRPCKGSVCWVVSDRRCREFDSARLARAWQGPQEPGSRQDMWLVRHIHMHIIFIIPPCPAEFCVGNNEICCEIGREG